MLKKLQNTKGQGTVEAAFVLPILMVLILLLLQPGIYLYDLIVMKSASSEACRLLAAGSVDDKTLDDYVRRRLSAIPQTDVFHVHGGSCTYQIDCVREESGQVSVVIKNELAALPLLDAFLRPMRCLNDDGYMQIEVKSTAQMQPSWTF